jgi:hypothetical protein
MDSQEEADFVSLEIPVIRLKTDVIVMVADLVAEEHSRPARAF